MPFPQHTFFARLRRYDLLRPASFVALAALAAVWKGKDANWDQLNYHYYIAYAFLTDRLGMDFLAASVQSYLNPLAHLPFYLLASSSLPSAVTTGVLGALHGLNLVLVYLLCKTILPPSAQRNPIAMVVTAMSAVHPVFWSELGTSLAELLACLPILAGMLCLLKLVQLDEARYRRWRTAGLGTVFVLLGAGAALKLPFVIFAAAGVPALVVRERSAKHLMTGVAIAVTGLALGFLAGGGFYALSVWRAFGNPFFPFFNNLFASPDYPVVKVVNDRFIQRSLADMAAFPFKMLLPHEFVTTERMVIDPRYAMMLGAALVVAARRVLRQTGGAVMSAPVAALLIAMAAVYPVWCLSSGNGRYALPLNLMSGPLLLALLILITRNTETIMRWAVTSLGMLSLLLYMTMGDVNYTLLDHTERWFNVDVPARAKVSGALYLTAGYDNRSTLSYLIPSFPRDAKFANINGYVNFAAGQPGGTKIERMVAAQGDRPIVILAEGYPRAPATLARANWIRNLNLNLNGFGLEMGDVDACATLLDRYATTDDGSPVQPFASVCPLRKRPPLEHRLGKVQVDHIFDAIEKIRPDLYYPAGAQSYFRAAAYCRAYTSTEYFVCEKEGQLTTFRMDPFFTLPLGSVEEWQAGNATSRSCKLKPSATCKEVTP